MLTRARPDQTALSVEPSRPRFRYDTTVWPVGLTETRPSSRALRTRAVRLLARHNGAARFLPPDLARFRRARARGTMPEDGDESENEYEEVDALEDSDDDFAYEEVDIDEDDDDLLGGDDEDLDAALRSLHTLGLPTVGANTTMKSEPPPGEVTKRPEVRSPPTTRVGARAVPILGHRASFSRVVARAPRVRREEPRLVARRAASARARRSRRAVHVEPRP